MQKNEKRAAIILLILGAVIVLFLVSGGYKGILGFVVVAIITFVPSVLYLFFHKIWDKIWSRLLRR
jgi:hypothetical protein